MARAGWSRAARRLNAQEGPSEDGPGKQSCWQRGAESGDEGARCTARGRAAQAALSWGKARTSESQVSEDAEMPFFHLEIHKFIHLEPSFYCMEMDVYAHVILTSRLSHPCIKQPREPKLIHLFATEDGSVSKLFY